MTGVVITVLIFFLLVAGMGGVAYLTYHKKLRRAKAIERGLKMVPVLIHLPPQSSDTQGGSRDLREVMREKTSQAEVLYNLIAGTATEGFKSNFYGQRHIALELVVVGGIVHFFAAVPVALLGVVKQAITTAYPGARLEEVEDHNIFNQDGRLAATLGGEMVLRTDSAYPIATYEQLERDPMEAILTSVSTLQKTDGVAIQIMLRPAGQGWVKHSITLADSIRQGKATEMKFSAMDLAKAALKAPAERRDEERLKGGGAQVSQLQLSQVERIEEKTKHPGFEVLIRVIVSTSSVMRSQQLLREISTAFALYENPGLNGFKFLPAIDVQGLVTAFIFRFFPNELKSNVLSSAELATLFHLPDAQFTPSASVARQQSKQVDGPVQLPATGLLFGYNEFRGAKKEIRLSPEDRRRHTYVLGQTGTGKSTMLENLAVQDMLAGNGFAFIDPHGDSAEKLLALVPKERAEDVIYFNPADTQYPLGLNLFEFNDPAQKDFLVQETINMLYKLYDPGHTGIIGPRYEHWYRNAALTLMSDPNGSTFIEIPKVFTDTEYLKAKFKYLKDPTVIDFWTKEMGQTSDYHKSEMLGWFVSKFGAFQNNEMMRNIIGQTKSSFSIRDVMDKKKILIVNLSKGRIGELNSQLLGMIFVIKFQAAAMSRADIPEEQRSDFALYVDEFQNFSTDSFASILSEARKYRLNLIVANQFIGQLSNEIRDAVFGNIGTIVAHRMGPDDAEFMTKQFAPVFDAGDLVNIPNYQAAMRLMIGGLPSQPFTLSDSAPIGAPNAELGVAVKQLSAAKYGHNKAEVEADLARRLTGQPGPAVPTADTTMPLGGAQPVAAVSAVSPAQAPAPVQAPAPAPVAAVVAAPAAVAAVAATMAPVSAPAPAAQPAGVALASLALTPGTDMAAAPATAPAPAVPSIESLAQLASAPPPIGAPPVELAMPAEAPAAQTQPAELAPVVSLAESAPTEPAPAMTAAADDASEQVMTNTPPPIGAPPMELPDLPTLKKAPVGTLSLEDITGRKRELVEEDPYAQIDVLGPSAPKVIKHKDSNDMADPEVVETEEMPEPSRAEEMALDTVTVNEMSNVSEPEPAPVAEPSELDDIQSAAPAGEQQEEPTTAADTGEGEITPAPSDASNEKTENDDDLLMTGLPEGVHFIDQPKMSAEPAQVSAPVMPVAAELPAAPIMAPAAVAAVPVPAAAVATVTAPVTGPAAPVAAPPAAPLMDEATALQSAMAVSANPVPEAAPAALVTAPSRVVAPPVDSAPAGDLAAPAAAAVSSAPSSAVEKAEQEIDDLLSVSLIHPDRHQVRLADPAEPSTDKPAAASGTTGMRVIQPLATIEDKDNEPKVEPVNATTTPVEPAAATSQPEAVAPQPAVAPPVVEEMQVPEATTLGAVTEAPIPAEPPTIADIQYDPSKAAQPAETVTAPADPAPVVPAVRPDTAAAAAPMPGSAIMPQAMSDRPVEEKITNTAATAKFDPKTLKPGEVHVDETGTVYIGGL